MKFKLTENSQKLVKKLHKEGLLSSFISSLQNSIRKQSDKEMEKIIKKHGRHHAQLMKQIKTDPDAVAAYLIKKYA